MITFYKLVLFILGKCDAISVFLNVIIIIFNLLFTILLLYYFTISKIIVFFYPNVCTHP